MLKFKNRQPGFKIKNEKYIFSKYLYKRIMGFFEERKRNRKIEVILNLKNC